MLFYFAFIFLFLQNRNCFPDTLIQCSCFFLFKKLAPISNKKKHSFNLSFELCTTVMKTLPPAHITLLIRFVWVWSSVMMMYEVWVSVYVLRVNSVCRIVDVRLILYFICAHELLYNVDETLKHFTSLYLLCIIQSADVNL